MANPLPRLPRAARSRYEHVMGIDASLTETAVVLVPTHWNGNWASVNAFGVGYSMESKAPVRDRITRCIANVAEVLQIALRFNVRQVHIEQYAFSKAYGAHQLGEYGGLLRARLLDADVDVDEVVMTAARALLLGKVKRDGVKVKSKVQEAWRAAGFPFWESHDAADAMTTLNYGLADVGGHFFGVAP